MSAFCRSSFSTGTCFERHELMRLCMKISTKTLYEELTRAHLHLLRESTAQPGVVHHPGEVQAGCSPPQTLAALLKIFENRSKTASMVLCRDAQELRQLQSAHGQLLQSLSILLARASAHLNLARFAYESRLERVGEQFGRGLAYVRKTSANTCFCLE